MLLVLEFGLLGYGIAALVRGQLELGGERVARGIAAYLAGLVFLLPLPIIVIALVLGFTQPQLLMGVAGTPALIFAEWGLVLGCLVVGMVIAFAGSEAGDPEYRRKARRRDDPESDEGRPEPSRRADREQPDGRFGTGPRGSRPLPPPGPEDDDEVPRPRRRRVTDDY